MKKIILLFMLGMATISGYAQGTTNIIKGTVTDAEDHHPLPGVAIIIKGTRAGTQTNAAGKYKIAVNSNATLVFTFIGYQRKEVKANKPVINIELKATQSSLSEVVVVGYDTESKRDVSGSVVNIPQPVGVANMKMLPQKSYDQAFVSNSKQLSANHIISPPAPVDESYKGTTENTFQNPINNPLSTFSADVDAASYTNVRRFINSGQLPPKDAVRIEEMVNYFSYDLPGPKDNGPVAIHTELTYAPWNTKHELLRIGLKARSVSTEKLPPSNLVFLIDVSGSMMQPNKLPLVQSSLKMLTDQLRAKDKVAIVVYAGNAGLVLPPTPGDQKNTIKDAIDRLVAGGSTAGGAGIRLAYHVAKENFIKGGNNRVILATDGDFNIGASSDQDMQSLIEDERKSGIFLSALGYGMGNYKDSKMEVLADKGNGNYAYIDNITEARKTLVSEFGGTLFTIAKDVKLQLEFNPAKVAAYRLIGYENRMLNKEDFNNDLKDAGDMGSGHTVTALYEIIPAGVHDSFTNSVDPLKYQKNMKPSIPYLTNDIVTIKFRYKQPDGDVSQLSQTVVADKPTVLANTSSDLRFAAAVAEFGMLLRNSDFKQNAKFSEAIEMARAAKGEDREGYRAEFVKLAESAKLLAKSNMVAEN